MHKLTLETGLVSGEVAVAVCSSLPIKGVSFILGNDLAGGRVLTAPEVVPFPVVSKRPDDLQKPDWKIPSAPFRPSPAIGEPFERILIDCVGLSPLVFRPWSFALGPWSLVFGPWSLALSP